MMPLTKLPVHASVKWGDILRGNASNLRAPLPAFSTCSLYSIRSRSIIFEICLQYYKRISWSQQTFSYRSSHLKNQNPSISQSTPRHCSTPTCTVKSGIHIILTALQRKPRHTITDNNQLNRQSSAPRDKNKNLTPWSPWRNNCVGD
jgi:hypothetical protein